MAYHQSAAGAQTMPIPMKTRKAPIRSIVTSVLPGSTPSLSSGFLNEGKQSRTEKSEPKPDKEAGTHVIDEYAHAQADQDTGRNDESVRSVLFPGFRQSVRQSSTLGVCDFSTIVCFHASFLMELIKKRQAMML